VRNFGTEAGGWEDTFIHPRLLGDMDGGGRQDIIGFGESGVWVSLGRVGGNFAEPHLASSSFGRRSEAGGWQNNDVHPRMLADVDGDLRADIIGFADAGVMVALGRADGRFSTPVLAVAHFGRVAGGWADMTDHPRLLADVNGDDDPDIVGFGEFGVTVSLGGAGSTFGAPFLALGHFGRRPEAGGWDNNDIYPRLLTDVSRDGNADIVGFGNFGVTVALGRDDGRFAAPVLVHRAFGHAPEAGGWANAVVHPRFLADVNGDLDPDIVGFGELGVTVSFGGAGSAFGPEALVLRTFGRSADAGGWVSNDVHPRFLTDVDRDGRADIVGFGNHGVFISLAESPRGGGGPFVAPYLAVAPQFGRDSDGWDDQFTYPRTLANLDPPNTRPDILGFARAGVFVALSSGCTRSDFAIETIARVAGATPRIAVTVSNRPQCVAGRVTSINCLIGSNEARPPVSLPIAPGATGTIVVNLALAAPGRVAHCSIGGVSDAGAPEIITGNNSLSATLR
jgi:hypothetical protein